MLEDLPLEMRSHVAEVCMALEKNAIDGVAVVDLADFISKDILSVCQNVAETISDLGLIEEHHRAHITLAKNPQDRSYKLTARLSKKGSDFAKQLLSINVKREGNTDSNTPQFKEIRDAMSEPLAKLLFDIMHQRWNTWERFRQSYFFVVNQRGSGDVNIGYDRLTRMLLVTSIQWADIEAILSIGGLEIKNITIELNGITSKVGSDQHVMH